MSKSDWLDMVQESAVTWGENWPLRIVKIPLDFFQGLENGVGVSHNSLAWFVFSVLFFSSFAGLVTRNPGFLNHLVDLSGFRGFHVFWSNTINGNPCLECTLVFPRWYGKDGKRWCYDFLGMILEFFLCKSGNLCVILECFVWSWNGESTWFPTRDKSCCLFLGQSGINLTVSFLVGGI